MTEGGRVDPSTTTTTLRPGSTLERPTATLKRAQSDSGQRVEETDRQNSNNALLGPPGGDYAMRHGWQEEYTSTEYLKVLHSVSSGRPMGVIAKY